MNKYSIQTTILIYIGFSVFILISVLSGFLVLDHKISLHDQEVEKVVLHLGTIFGVMIILIVGGFYLLLKKLLNPLKYLVKYCNNSSKLSLNSPKCQGSYEVNCLQDAIINLENTNKILCKEKQDIFREAAHEIKTPISILKARLSLFANNGILKEQFIQECTQDITTISNKLRELIFLKAIEFDIQQAKESVTMQNQCSMMQQLFRPILEKKNLKMVSNLQTDFELYIYKEAIGRVMQAIFENIFMNTKNGTTIYTYIDVEKQELRIVNEIGKENKEILFSSHIGSQLIKRLADKLEYKYHTYEKNKFFHTIITFKSNSTSLTDL